jgi:hypothetical protein
VDVSGWFSDLWDTLTGVGLGYLLAGWVLQTVQTTLTRARLVLHPARRLPPRAVPLPHHPCRLCDRRGPERLPAGEHRHGRDAADVHGDRPRRETSSESSRRWACRRSSSRLAGAFVYVYLFAACRGRSSSSSTCSTTHPALAVVLALGAVMLIVILGRIFWRKLEGLWQKVKQGGAHPGRARATTPSRSCCPRSAAVGGEALA